jgi:hypothetical protein
MGFGDSIRKAAENAAEDLGAMSEPADDGHAPEPDAPDPSESDTDPSGGIGRA